MSAHQGIWTGEEALPVGEVRLLEASAGTGKTWQIAHLVTRLVAEEAVPIERILLITFTKAATAELRERVRRRLVDARHALESTAAPPSDPLLARLCQGPEREIRRTRVQLALANFDQAPISTIHGFSQRMLTQLAFESGQETGLELIADVRPVLEELVADELARVYADANEVELGLIEDMGWSREALFKLAKQMAAAVAPSPLPERDPLVEGCPLALARLWLEKVAAHRTWLSSDEGEQARQAFRDELARPAQTEANKRKVPAKRFNGVKIKTKPEALDLLWQEMLESLEQGAAYSVRDQWQKPFDLERMQAAWTEPGTFEAFAAFALFDRCARLLDEQEQLWPQARVAFAMRARLHVENELQRRGLLSYDAMLSRLAERVGKEGAEGPLAAALRARFDVALVDEFQDTDAAQWQLLDAVFRHPERRLLLIGDPKQAIYSFRGADVHVYLNAAGVGTQRATMGRNYRSDAGYVAAMNGLWQEGSQAFAVDAFDYVQVDAAREQPESRIAGVSPLADAKRRPLEVRWFDGTTLGDDSALLTQKVVGEQLAASLCAREAAALLGGQVKLDKRKSGDDLAQLEPLQPGDIAVLVRTNDQGALMRNELARLGIPAVTAGRGSVFASPACAWLTAWLDAVARPASQTSARTLATTPLFGWTLGQLAKATSGEAAQNGGAWIQWLSQIAKWSHTWTTQGFFRVWEGALTGVAALARVLQTPDGERMATDLRHLAELCHAEERRTRPGPGALATWLRAQAANAKADDDSEEALRLESDARAVQIVTLHKSKGLEYPIVLLPFAWSSHGGAADKGQPISHHADDGALRIDLRPKGAQGRGQSIAAANAEARHEDLRILYVGLTRAAHHCVVWLGPVGDTAAAPGHNGLASLLLRERDGAGRVTGTQAPKFEDYEARDPGSAASAQPASNWQALLTKWTETAPHLVGWSSEPLLSAPRPPAEMTQPSQVTLEAARWPEDRQLGGSWQVASFTSLVAGRTLESDEPTRPDDRSQSGALEPSGAAEPEPATQAGVETADAPRPRWPAETHLGGPAPLATLRGGTEIGTWVHSVLEHLDFTTCSAKDGGTVEALALAHGGQQGVTGKEAGQLARHLPDMLQTPLDGAMTRLPAGWCLAKLPAKDRIDELGFDLSLAGGTHWRPRQPTVQPEAVQAALSERLGDPSWGGQAWLEAVCGAEQVFPRMAGLLTGFIDLVLRVGGRYYVADYKTNRIAEPGNRQHVLRGHYTQVWLQHEMARHGYYLQALLYMVALHRWLRQRLRGYDYSTHVGGHLYLFVRGMEGAGATRDRGLSLGVLHDCWPEPVVVGLDAALAGKSAAEVRAAMAAVTPPSGTVAGPELHLAATA